MMHEFVMVTSPNFNPHLVCFEDTLFQNISLCFLISLQILENLGILSHYLGLIG